MNDGQAKMMRRAWVLIYMVFSVLPLRAQEQATRESPIESLVMDQAQIVTVYPRIDNAARTLSVFVEGVWKTIAYPESLDHMVQDNAFDHNTRWSYRSDEYASITTPMALQPDGTIFLSGKLREASEGTNNQRLWLVDPQKGSFELFESPCVSQGIVEDERAIFPPDIATLWTRVQTPDETHFCHLLTGKRTKALPRSDDWSQALLSPNGVYLYFSDENTITEYSPALRYSYNLETEEILDLGTAEIQRADNYYDLGWLTPAVYGFMVRDMPEWSNGFIYLVDMSRRNSFKLAVTTWRFDPFFSHDPDALMTQYALVDNNAPPNTGPCYMDVFDFASFESTTYETGTFCDYGYAIPDGSGDRLYHALYPGAGLVRYNIFTGKREQIFVGEIEEIGSASHEGTYARISLDHSGELDVIKNYGFCCSEYTGFSAPPTIIRLADGVIVGTVPTDAEWISDRHLLNDKTLYTVTNDSITVMPLWALGIQPVTVLSDREQILVRSAYGAYLLYDLETQQMIPLFQYSGPSGVHFQLINNGLLHMTLIGTTQAPAGRYSYGNDDKSRIQGELDIRLP
jgi:hypothetical protein